MADGVWSGWQQIATSQEVNIGLNNKTDKNEYKVYTPYGEGENTEENPCDLYKLDRGSAVLPALVSVKNSPFLDNKVRDATVFVPSRHFGWQLLGEFQGLFYQRFDWEGNPWGGWEQIAFASMLSNRNLLYNVDFKLNQRGKSKYEVTNRYSVDRWMGWNTIITPCKNGIDIGIAGTGYWEFRQYLEYKKKDLLGKYLTMSICIDGIVYSKTFDQVPDSIEGTWGNDKNIFGALNTRITVKEDIFIFWIYNNGLQSYHIDWMKLEFGRIATPFIPPNPAVELVECQRYYKRIYLGALSAYQYYTEKNRVYFNYHFGAMRTKTPTVAFIGMKAEANYPTENYFAVTKGGNAVLGWSVSKDVQFEIILNNYENVSIIATLPDSIPVTNKDFTLHFGKGAGIEVDDEIYP